MRTPVKIGAFAVALFAGISAARADTVVIQDYTTATQFAAAFGTPPPTFNGIALPSGFFFVGGSLVAGSVTYNDSGNSELFLEAAAQGFDIGTGNTLLVDEGPNNTNANINLSFAAPVSIVGLIVGDAFAAGGDAALFNVTFGDASSVTGIGGDGSLPITGGDPPNFIILYDIGGNGISQINFSDTAGDPTIDTVTSSTPEPNSAWLLAMPILALGIRKWKTLRSGAAPLAVLALFAMLAIPSFAQPVNCNLAVPNNPLTAAGLATPYLLSAGDPGCSQAAGTMAFVQAAIYDPAAHTISVYTPLVADAPPSTPGVPRTPRYAISPVLPTLPPNAVVAIWFGYNANNLTLTGTAVTNGTCFTGFGQYASCNTTAFWAAVNADTTLQTNIWNAFKGQTGLDGQACPTSRSYSIVDQDPTDNLPVSFLLTNETTPRVAQNTILNRGKFATMFGAPGPSTWSIQINPSDEAVVDKFIDGALGCNPPVVADLTDPGQTHASLAVNELFAALSSGQFPAVNNTSIYPNTPGQLYGPAFVAIGDTFNLSTPFTQPLTPIGTYPYAGAELTAFDNYVAAMGYAAPLNSQTIQGTLSQAAGSAFVRTNQYRASVNQPLANYTATVNMDGSLGDASVQTYCTRLFTRTAVGDNSPADLLFNKDLAFFNQAANGPGGGNLFIFLGDRFAVTYDLLGCASVFNQPNPVNLTNVNATVAGTSSAPYYPAVFPPLPPH